MITHTNDKSCLTSDFDTALSLKNFTKIASILLFPCMALTQPLETEVNQMTESNQTVVGTSMPSPSLTTASVSTSTLQGAANSSDPKLRKTQTNQAVTASFPSRSSTLNVATKEKLDAASTDQSNSAGSPSVMAKVTEDQLEKAVASEISSPPRAKASVVINRMHQATEIRDSETQNMISMGIAAGGAVLAVSASMVMTARRLRQPKKTGDASKVNPVDTSSTQSDLSDSAKVGLQEEPSDELATVATSELQKAPKSDVMFAGASSQAYIEPAAWMSALMRSYPDRIKPILSSNHALTCIAGPRSNNQDYVCSFELKARASEDVCQVMIVADGCGGHFGGSDASCMAVRFASESVIHNINLLSHDALLSKAFVDASNALQTIGSMYWGSNDLRTTLIVLIATSTTYHVGWIGDGGVSLRRIDGQWQELITPHKGEYQNVLEASLGPTQDGEPSFIQAQREPGDHLYLGSDGIFDVVDHSFWDWFEGSIQMGAFPQVPMDQLIELAGKDPHFDDNMSVAFLKTPPADRNSKTIPMRRNAAKESPQVNYESSETL